MTQELFDKAYKKYREINRLELLCEYNEITVRNNHNNDLARENLLIKDELQAILDEANEKVRERARKALEIAKQEFEAL